MANTIDEDRTLTGLDADKESGITSSMKENPTIMDETMTPAEEKALVRRIDMRLMPLLVISYMIQYLDKTTLGYTAILGLPQDTKLVGDQYSWVPSAFYFGYLIASYPAAYGFVKLPIGKFLAVSALIWSVVLACHGAASTFVGLTVLRVLLGIFESTISPGFTLMTAMWYKAAEHPVRACFWFSGNCIGAALGGLLAYAIGHIHSGIEAWRWLFIIFGIVSVFWALILLYFLPDHPLTARWLNPTQQKLANNRVQVVQLSQQTKKWEQKHFIEALIDPQTWFLSIYLFVLCLPNGGITNFLSIIIKGFGFTTLQTLLLTMPGPVLVLFIVLAIASISRRFRKARCILMAVVCVISLIGILLVRELPSRNRAGRLVGIYLASVFGSGFPLCVSMVSSNVAGYTKKTTVGAILFIFYCAGNIAGPLVFKAKEAPHYQSAYAALLVCFVIGVVDILALGFYLDWQNKRRDRALGRVIEAEPKIKPESQVSDPRDTTPTDQIDVSDWENKEFRYFL